MAENPFSFVLTCDIIHKVTNEHTSFHARKDSLFCFITAFYDTMKLYFYGYF